MTSIGTDNWAVMKTRDRSGTRHPDLPADAIAVMTVSGWTQKIVQPCSSRDRTPMLRRNLPALRHTVVESRTRC